MEPALPVVPAPPVVPALPVVPPLPVGESNRACGASSPSSTGGAGATRYSCRPGCAAMACGSRRPGASPATRGTCLQENEKNYGYADGDVETPKTKGNLHHAVQCRVDVAKVQVFRNVLSSTGPG